MAVNGCRASPVLFGWMEGTKAGDLPRQTRAAGSGVLSRYVIRADCIAPPRHNKKIWCGCPRAFVCKFISRFGIVPRSAMSVSERGPKPEIAFLFLMRLAGVLRATAVSAPMHFNFRQVSKALRRVHLPAAAAGRRRRGRPAKLMELRSPRSRWRRV